MTEIAGKTALVTGGGSGIGRGLVLGLVDEGASVAVVDLLQDRAEEVAAEVRHKGGTAVALSCDVSDRASVKRMKEEANETLGPVQLLFANAGVTWFDRLTEMKDEDIDWLIGVNLMGVFNCVTAFLPDMISAGEGHVVATASNAGLNSGWVPYHVVYSSTKSAVIAMMLNLRIELDEVGIGTTVYCPGGTGPSRIGESIHHRPERFGGPLDKSPDDLMKAVGPEWTQKNIVGSFDAYEISPHIMRAIKENSAMVVDHSNQRWAFFEHFVNHAVEAFDEAEKFEQTLPQSS
jgi:NAD(P)-dependent dehydrogenase (short-subunit alcohol dehydrogenase family)